MKDGWGERQGQDEGQHKNPAITATFSLHHIIFFILPCYRKFSSETPRYHLIFVTDLDGTQQGQSYIRLNMAGESS